MQLWQLHADHGDQSAGSKWAWKTNVAADAAYGVVVDADRGACRGNDIMDPELVKNDGGWLAFFNTNSDGIVLTASGFACSDFIDNGDADADADWPADLQCTNPWDSAE